MPEQFGKKFNTEASEKGKELNEHFENMARVIGNGRKMDLSFKILKYLKLKLKT